MLRRPALARLGAAAAVCTVLACIAPASAAPAERPASPFAWRGIVEGFYGTPYSPAQRTDLLRFEAAHGMNAYVHAPKQDPYVRTLWRHPYPDADLQELRSEVSWARAHGIAWIPDVGPGVPLIPSPNVAAPDADICFSCPADRQLLIDRYRPFVAAGSSAVMVSFDDTDKVSSHPEDAQTYGQGDAAYGAMNADAVNAVARAFPHVQVLAVPADYSGTSSTAYLQAFAQRLDRRVVVLWTGTAIVAPTIRGADAAAFGRIVHRPVLVWDNYPTNDYAGGAVDDPTNLFMGPLTGRGPDLVGNVAGILANPMNEWAASKLPLATVADFLNDPEHYRPEQSWRVALRQLGGADTAVLAKVVENLRSSPLGQTDAVTVAPLIERFLAEYPQASWPAAAGRLRAELAAEQAAPDRLRAAHVDSAFLDEAGPFLSRLTANAAIALQAVDLLAAQRPAVSLSTRRDGQRVLVSGVASPPSPAGIAADLATLHQDWVATLPDRHNVHGNRFAYDLGGNVYAAHNAVDTFVHTTEALTAQWTPSAPAAARGVTVTVDGRPVPATFTVAVPAHHVVTVVVTDGAGHQTRVVLRT